MQPTFRIIADTTDITEAIRDRLVELQVTDEAGIKSDQVRLTLDDRPAAGGAVAALPKIGTTLKVALGYAETALTDMGVYTVDEMDIRHPPATLVVTAKAANMVGPFRSPKTRSWDNTTMGAMVDTIAKENGYTPKVDKELAAIALPHVDQRGESDMALLTRLAENYDAVAKPIHTCLVLAKQGEAKTASGKSLPVISLTQDMLTSWSYRYCARKDGSTADAKGGDSNKKGGHRAYWHDLKKGRSIPVTVGKEPYRDLPTVYKTEAEAKAAIAAKTNKGKRSEGSLSLTLPGDTRLAAECKLVLPLRQGLPTEWRIKKVEHTLGSRGFVSTVEAERFVANQLKVTASSNAAALTAARPPVTPDNNTAEWAAQFEAVRDKLENAPGLSDKDALLLCLPEIAKAEADKCWTADNKKGWLYLQSMFHKWFSGKMNMDAEADKTPLMVDIEWILSYNRARLAFANLAEYNYLFSKDALIALANNLRRDEYLQAIPLSFDYINQPWTQWKKGYFQQIVGPGILSLIADGMTASMGNFVFRALAAGRVEPNHLTGGHDVYIDKVAIIAWDSFNFEGEYDLKYWKCLPPSYSSFGLLSNDTNLYNHDFAVFRKAHFYGNDFLVLSGPKMLEGFHGTLYNTNHEN